MRVSFAWKKTVKTFRHGLVARPRPPSQISLRNPNHIFCGPAATWRPKDEPHTLIKLDGNLCRGPLKASWLSES